MSVSAQRLWWAFVWQSKLSPTSWGPSQYYGEFGTVLWMHLVGKNNFSGSSKVLFKGLPKILENNTWWYRKIIKYCHLCCTYLYWAWTKSKSSELSALIIRRLFIENWCRRRKHLEEKPMFLAANQLICWYCCMCVSSFPVITVYIRQFKHT